MANYDVFNGDADGICALQQLRLQTPRDATLITGLKRDIDLLQRIEPQSGDDITVLDISLDKNRDALIAALATGARVFYADHHFPGDIPVNELFDCHIDVAADTCTSLIINNLLDHAQARWAVVGAFGDNFDQSAAELGNSLGLDAGGLDQLQQLGICLNYNGYGFEIGRGPGGRDGLLRREGQVESRSAVVGTRVPDEAALSIGGVAPKEVAQLRWVNGAGETDIWTSPSPGVGPALAKKLEIVRRNIEREFSSRRSSISRCRPAMVRSSWPFLRNVTASVSSRSLTFSSSDAARASASSSRPESTSRRPRLTCESK